MSAFLRAAWTIAAKDLRSELRTKEALNASFAFSMVILVLFSFAFDPSEELPDIAGGLLWLVFSFAGALVLNRSFARELQNDCLDALIASPAPIAAIFLGKALANFVAADDRRNSIAGCIRRALRYAFLERNSGRWCWSCCWAPGR